MKKSNEDKLNKIIKEVVHQNLEDAPSPPMSSEESWIKIKDKLNEKRKNNIKSRFFQRKLVYVTSAILLLITLIFFSPQSSEAYNKLTEIFQKIQGSVVQLFTQVGDDHPQENIPTSNNFSIVEDSEIISEKLNFEEAQKDTAFTIKLPKFVPKEFVLDSVTVTKENNSKGEDIILNYESELRGFRINQKLVSESFSSGIIADDYDTNVEKVDIFGTPASLLHYKNGTLEIMWVTQGRYYSIKGQLSKNEIIEIAKSM